MKCKNKYVINVIDKSLERNIEVKFIDKNTEQDFMICSLFYYIPMLFSSTRLFLW